MAIAEFDVERMRGQFAALAQRVHGKPLVYLDNAATTQKPEAVLSAMDRFYRESNANVHRGLHELSVRATRGYESARETAAAFLGAATPRECIFTSGVTDALNLVAGVVGQARLRAGDRVLLTEMEHHSNIVPWQMACERVGAGIDVIPVTEAGELDLDAAARLMSERTRVVSCVMVSNVLGTVNDVARVCGLAREAGALSVIDAAQAAAHGPIDVGAIGCDFLAIAGHKMYGPTGIGVLYGREELLRSLPPYRGGGEMIETVRFSGSTYAAPPARYEAGTPNIAGAIGCAAAMDFVRGLDGPAVRGHEAGLLRHAQARLGEIDGLRIIGMAERKIPIVTFTLEGVHPYDLSPLLDRWGIAIRTGHHCTQPLMERFGVKATARASFALYNTLEEVDALADGIEKARRMLA
jgi:cysteine desulfurase/selenocysteine lyase